MLIAAAAGDSQRFDQIWNWTKQNLRRDDGLISFKWRDGKVEDPEAASDADVDAARALLGGLVPLQPARQAPGGPGAGQGDPKQGDRRGRREAACSPPARGPTTSPRRSTPATSHRPPSRRWARPRATTALGQPLGQRADDHRPADDRLLAAAAGLGEARGRQAGADRHAGRPGGTPKFSFDAPRTLVRFAEDPDQAGRGSRPGHGRCSRDQDPNQIVVERDLAGKPTGGTKHPIVLVAAAGAADAAGKDERPRQAAERGLGAGPGLVDVLRLGLGGDRSLHAADRRPGRLLGAAPLAHRP